MPKASGLNGAYTQMSWIYIIIFWSLSNNFLYHHHKPFDIQLERSMISSSSKEIYTKRTNQIGTKSFVTLSIHILMFMEPYWCPICRLAHKHTHTYWSIPFSCRFWQNNPLPSLIRCFFINLDWYNFSDFTVGTGLCSSIQTDRIYFVCFVFFPLIFFPVNYACVYVFIASTLKFALTDKCLYSLFTHSLKSHFTWVCECVRVGILNCTNTLLLLMFSSFLFSWCFDFSHLCINVGWYSIQLFDFCFIFH